jgi:hypothetical protein
MQTDDPELPDLSSQQQSYLTTPMPESATPLPESRLKPVEEVKIVETVYKLDWVEVENRVRLIVS